jgi:hypothetical protein
MSKLNCWEIKKCGREPGGSKTFEHEVCPATSKASCNGINNGTNGGRICWAIAGTLCGNKIQGDFTQKSVSCMSCDVFRQVKADEGANDFDLLIPGQVYDFTY